MQRRFVILTGIGEGGIQSEEFSMDTPLAENEAVIETDMSMISAGTELSRVYAIKQGFSYPVYPGYTAVGRILRRGEGLMHLSEGDRVFYAGPHASVNRHRHMGTTQGEKILPIDPRLSDRQACLIQMGLIAMNAVTACHGKLTDTAAVYGLGTIGLTAALLLRREGMRVICFDTVSSRVEAARRLGLTESFDIAPEVQGKTLMELTDGRGSEVSVDATGAPPAIINAVAGTAKHGQVILLGSPRAPFTVDITPVFNAIHMKMLEVKGAFNALNPFSEVEGSGRSVEKDFAAVQRLLLDGTLDDGVLISHVIAPEEIMQAYHGLMYEREVWRCAAIDWQRGG